MGAFKKYDGSVWQSINPKQLKGIPYSGTLPAVLTGTKAGYLHKYKIYGNLSQNGTPTPENPIVPSECGELETTGVHAGQYKLPLLSGSTPVDIYLGESQTTRRIKKLVLTGQETWNRSSSYIGSFFAYLNQFPGILNEPLLYCSHLLNVTELSQYQVGTCFVASASVNLWIFDESTTVANFKSYLAQQYANGTPVTVWYVLATEETGTFNEPLRKIGDYADTIDSTQTTTQIPTSANSTTISWAGEGLAPSEFDSIQEWVDIPTYTYTNGEWVADNSN